MKNIFTLSLILLVSGVLSSSQLAYSDKDFVGSWKIKTIIKSNGKRKKGDHLVTFFADHTTVSQDLSSKTSRYGKWFYNSLLNQIQLTNDEKDSEIMDVLKVSKTKLVLSTDGKTFKLVKKKMTIENPNH